MNRWIRIVEESVSEQHNKLFERKTVWRTYTINTKWISVVYFRVKLMS